MADLKAEGAEQKRETLRKCVFGKGGDLGRTSFCREGRKEGRTIKTTMADLKAQRPRSRRERR
jgi:hypothetical protein